MTLVISDVPGDDPATIASGPTVADASTLSDVWEIVNRYGIELSPAARTVLESGAETPKPVELESDVRLIAAPSLALVAAADAAGQAGVTSLILGDASKARVARSGPSWPALPARFAHTDCR